MAAYAALVSLFNTVEQIQNHPRLSVSLDRNQIKSLGETIHFLLEFVESYNSDGGRSEGEMEELKIRIASAAYAAEDVIESHVADQILAVSSKESPISLLDLEIVIEELDSVKVRVLEGMEEWRRFEDEQLLCSSSINSSRPLKFEKTPMVGFDGYMIQLLDLLLYGRDDLQIIPIVGMGGIGKTTIARNAFDHPIIVQHFDARAWVTLSQDFNLVQMLLEILLSLGVPTSELDGKTLTGELGIRLYKSLFGRRYLLVLDDVWSTDAWDSVKYFFPDHHNGSRIIITTRLSYLASYIGSSKLEINFLDEEQSWELFRNWVFVGESCPPHLVDIGKAIVQQCRGLPLAIIVIAGLLQKSPKTRESWENIERNVSSSVNFETGEQMFQLLHLSYNHLPAHLKPCFLYMGVFPESYEIRASQLIKLWVAEGILNPIPGISLEKVAEESLQNLIDRGLILVGSLGSNGKLKTCNMHDLLRDLCLKVATKEKFLVIKRVFNIPQDKNWERRIIFQGSTDENSELLHTLESAPFSRTLISESPAMISFKSRLLRVLIEVYSDSIDATFQHVNLRFLSWRSIHAPFVLISTYKLPSSISLLWNVQTLIIYGIVEKVVAPSEIWEMSQLRHLQFHRVSLPDPPLSNDEGGFVLKNLQTLRTVLDFRCSQEVCWRMPNIEKLRIFYDDFSEEDEYGLPNVDKFNRLESLHCGFNAVPDRDDLLKNLKFPQSLKKLVLEYCELHWSDLSMIGSLPFLEVLKLKHQSVRGRRWQPVEGGFQHLKYLEIDSCYLIHWDADCFHYPSLEKLVLIKLNKLTEIPSDMGEIPTLINITVVDCSISVAMSAARILKEQEDMGNEQLQVRVSFFSQKMKLEEFRERLELEGLSSSNLHIDSL